MNLNKKVNRDSLYFDYVNILNGVLQLSNREAEVFSYLLMSDSKGDQHDINNKKVRSIIKSKVGISEANLSRYLNTIKKKGLIVKSENNRWVINDNIRPVIEHNEKTNKDEIKVNFILNIIKTKTNEENKMASGYSNTVKS